MGLQFPTPAGLSSSARLPAPGRTPVSLWAGLCGGGTGEKGPWSAPSLPPAGLPEPPLPWAAPSCTDPRETLTPSRLVRQGATATDLLPGGVGLCTPWLSYSASLSLRLLICTMRASRAFLRIRWERTTGWSGGRGAWPALRCCHSESGLDRRESNGGPWGTFALKWAKMQTSTLRALDPRVASCFRS